MSFISGKTGDALELVPFAILLKSGSTKKDLATVVSYPSPAIVKQHGLFAQSCLVTFLTQIPE